MNKFLKQHNRRSCGLGRSVLFAWLLVTAALLVAACGSQAGTTSGAGGTSPGATGTTSGAGGTTPGATNTPTAPARLTGSITEFPLSSANSNPLNIAAGPDGNLWFTDSGTNEIGRITPEGQITEFRIPTPGEFPWSITAGPDGNVWFRACVPDTSTGRCGTKKIGRITPTGQITEFPLSSLGSPLSEGITAGPDGNLWFADVDMTGASSGGKIGRITPAGQITEFSLPTPGSSALGITSGPDGNLWFTDGSGKIGRITPQGTITEFPLSSANSNPIQITTGPDGNLWFTECPYGGPGSHLLCTNSQLGRITPQGTITEFPLPMSSPDVSIELNGITAGPDGNVWFMECQDAGGNQCINSKIARITPTGQISEFPLTMPASYPHDITLGPDKNLWFTEQTTRQIGRFTPGK